MCSSWRAVRICSWALSALFLVSVPLLAQPPLFEPPQGFYKARGNPVTPTWSVDRTTLPEDETLTATLTIEGAINPQEVLRPDLTKLRLFTDRFQIENVPGPSDVKTPRFIYRLRPRNAKVDRLPTLEFYYDSGVKVGNPFKPRPAKGIDIVVAPVVKAKPAVVPLIEPDQLFAIEETSAVLSKPPFAAGWMSWVGLLVLGILGAVCWYVVWRRMYPDGARLAKLRRNRAMRRALDAIRRANSAEGVAKAVLGYLRSQCPMAAGCVTPSEVAESLRSGNIAHAEEVEAFLRHCDAARFSTASDIGVSLADEARSLLARLEAAA